jgi:hypothetical protein
MTARPPAPHPDDPSGRRFSAYNQGYDGLALASRFVGDAACEAEHARGRADAGRKPSENADQAASHAAFDEAMSQAAEREELRKTLPLLDRGRRKWGNRSG